MGDAVEAIHHVAVFTADYAATAAFYRDVFGADAPGACEQPSAIRIGGATLHVFEEPGVRADWKPVRLHHFALLSTGLEAFVAIRDALVRRGASDGDVQDFGSHVSLLASDPDGGMLEVMLPADAASGELPFAVRRH